MPLLPILLATSVGANLVAATNSTAITTVGWVSDPNGRGTFSLVLSCVLTLGLCVWSAMHLNIPPHGASKWHNWIRSFIWGLTGIFGPELVVFAAWRQYNSAKTLRSLVDSQMARSSTKDQENLHSWTMVHSFYAGMGGFIFDLGSIPDGTNPQFIPGEQHLTISARGIALLAQCGHLPNIPKEDIVDKSKADSLAKSLVCLQAGWMVVQIIGRLILGLPISLLEVNILGHVLCALVIYLLWWHKPRLVNEPTILRGPWVKTLCAYMFMSSQISGPENATGALWQAWLEPEIMSHALFVPKLSKASELSEHSDGTLLEQLPSWQSDSTANPIMSANDDLPAGELASLLCIRPRPMYPHSFTGTYELSSRTEQALDPSSMEAERWRLATEAIQTYPSLSSRFKANTDVPTSDYLDIMPEELLTRGSSNWPAEDLLRGTEGLIMGMSLWFASMAYGAVHLAAWNDYFPTAIEQWLWRSSAIYISFSGALWLMINLMAHRWKTLNAYWDSVLRRQAHWVNYVVLGVTCTVCGVAYVGARLFLVVEAFVSIRQLPVEAYDSPNWTKFLPHI